MPIVDHHSFADFGAEIRSVPEPDVGVAVLDVLRASIRSGRAFDR